MLGLQKKRVWRTRNRLWQRFSSGEELHGKQSVRLVIAAEKRISNSSMASGYISKLRSIGSSLFMDLCKMGLIFKAQCDSLALVTLILHRSSLNEH